MYDAVNDNLPRCWFYDYEGWLPSRGIRLLRYHEGGRGPLHAGRWLVCRRPARNVEPKMGVKYNEICKQDHC